MSPSETSRVCCICKKLFCCAECRTRHEKKKHPDRQLNCPLCCSEKLPLQSIADKSLFNHIAIKHLPLCCSLCGEIFNRCNELESFGVCKWWESQYRHFLARSQKSLLGTPPLVSEEKGSEQSTINGEYNGNFDNLTSPPELHRNTSTPMVLGQKNNIEFKTPNVPNFSLKTPKTNSAISTKSQIRSYQVSKDDNSESNYISFPSTNQEETPFRSLSSHHSDTANHLVRNNSGRKLANMEELNETSMKENCNDNHDVEDMELTSVEGEALPDSQCLENSSNKTGKRAESIKRVRFSDQYESFPESHSTHDFNATENDEFFEARDSISHVKESRENSPVKIVDENRNNTELKVEEEKVEGTHLEINEENNEKTKLEISEGKDEKMELQIDKGNNENIPLPINEGIYEKMQLQINEKMQLQINEGNNKEIQLQINEEEQNKADKENRSPSAINAILNRQSSGSSRVLMMLLVENSSVLTTADLLSSGLKKLEDIASDTQPSTSNQNSPSSSNSVASVDTYYSVSSHECYSAINSPRPFGRETKLESNASSSSGGIFSVVTNAVRSVMKNLSGSSKAIAREQIPQTNDSLLRSSTSEASSTIASFTSSLLRRPAKRPRDTIESPPLPSRRTDIVVPQIEITSPLAKRPRGWHKIKAREPIGRLRNNPVTSPRGVSSETQVFSQGSLSVGDTVLPLPARAHQSTQTD